ncbi:hypothetical protein B14911_19515 [Bacillus sp. NRRL B-14911]|nr:hypothetical protein B14911_19515 [Bacillus sp. NRRL B-14911]
MIMRILFTYLPVLSFVFVLFLMDDGIFKWTLLVCGIVLVALAKMLRVRMKEEEVEFDDRVNANIAKWSLRSIYLLNFILIVLLCLETASSAAIGLDKETILIYLLATLFIPFYIIPAIVKKL